MIDEGVNNGLLCEPGDATCLARKIGLLIENPQLRIELGCAARKSYETGPFQPASLSDELSVIYIEIVNP